jgi:Fe-S oxidoreductase
MFREEYDLPGMTVLHHSEYILQLIEWKRIKPAVAQLAAAYHDPCELGRGCGVREEPKALIGKLFRENVTPQVNGLCCGGSLAAPALGLATRRAVARGAYTELTAGNPDVLITSCPLCKKTFDPVAGIPVLDIAEASARMLQPATASLAHDSFSRSMATFEPCKTNAQPAYCLND